MNGANGKVPVNVTEAIPQPFLEGLDVVVNEAAVRAFVVPIFDHGDGGVTRPLDMIPLMDGSFQKCFSRSLAGQSPSFASLRSA